MICEKYNISTQTRISDAHLKVADISRLLVLYSNLLGLGVMLKIAYPLTGAGDRCISEALYLDDPNGNWVELYWDKLREQYPTNEDGSFGLVIHSLDLNNILNDWLAK